MPGSAPPVARRTEAESAAWHARPAGEVLTALASSTGGLSSGEAQARRERLGANVLPRAAGEGPLRVLARQVNNPIIYLLLAATGLAIAVGKVVDGSVVLAAVAINVLIGFVQELRATKAIEALSRMVPSTATVLRDGRRRAVPAEELVPGDVVQIAAGDRVPADLRLLAVQNLRVEEAALTGESVPAVKSDAPVDYEAPIGDRTCMAYGGTLVTTGAASAVVAATGGATELGRISRMLREAEELETPLTRAIARVGRWLTVMVVVVAAVLLGIAVLRDYPFADGVLIAIALAVATIPEGLPAIPVTTLEKSIETRLAARERRRAADHRTLTERPA